MDFNYIMKCSCGKERLFISEIEANKYVETEQKYLESLKIESSHNMTVNQWNWEPQNVADAQKL